MESELLAPRIYDIVDICNRTNKSKYLGFLSIEQMAFAQKTLEKYSVKFAFFGGYKSASRVMLGCFPDWAEEFVFPISCITFKFKKEYSLTHRDFLGALMALGITRESVGDILVEQGRAVAFLNDDIKDYVLNQITKIGRVGVVLKEGFDLPLPKESKLEEFSDTIPSNRLDCIVSSLACVSRNKASELIENGFVSVNSQIFQKNTKEVFENDVITIKGKGKFIIFSLSNKTKKQRTILKYKKYV